MTIVLHPVVEREERVQRRAGGLDDPTPRGPRRRARPPPRTRPSSGGTRRRPARPRPSATSWSSERLDARRACCRAPSASGRGRRVALDAAGAGRTASSGRPAAPSAVGRRRGAGRRPSPARTRTLRAAPIVDRPAPAPSASSICASGTTSVTAGGSCPRTPRPSPRRSMIVSPSASVAAVDRDLAVADHAARPPRPPPGCPSPRATTAAWLAQTAGRGQDPGRSATSRGRRRARSRRGRGSRRDPPRRPRPPRRASAGSRRSRRPATRPSPVDQRQHVAAAARRERRAGRRGAAATRRTASSRVQRERRVLGHVDRHPQRRLRAVRLPTRTWSSHSRPCSIVNSMSQQSRKWCSSRRACFAQLANGAGLGQALVEHGDRLRRDGCPRRRPRPARRTARRRRAPASPVAGLRVNSDAGRRVVAAVAEHHRLDGDRRSRGRRRSPRAAGTPAPARSFHDRNTASIAPPQLRATGRRAAARPRSTRIRRRKPVAAVGGERRVAGDARQPRRRSPSLSPRLRIVSIIPGIDRGAPDRTRDQQRVGRVPEPPPDPASSVGHRGRGAPRRARPASRAARNARHASVVIVNAGGTGSPRSTAIVARSRPPCRRAAAAAPPAIRGRAGRRRRRPRSCGRLGLARLPGAPATPAPGDSGRSRIPTPSPRGPPPRRPAPRTAAPPRSCPWRRTARARRRSRRSRCRSSTAAGPSRSGSGSRSRPGCGSGPRRRRGSAPSACGRGP